MWLALASAAVACAVVGGSATAQPPAGNGKIAFVAPGPAYNPENIFTMNADGSGATDLTSGTDYESRAVWAPDGSKLAFVRSSEGQSSLFVMNADGSRLRSLGASTNGWPSWSPDGQRLVFTDGPNGATNVFVANDDGSARTQLTTDGTYDASPTWSPAGNVIAFDDGRDISLIDADGTHRHKLTDTPESDNLPSWSPDGLRVAFAHVTGQETHLDGGVSVVDRDGSHETTLSRTVAYTWSPLSWSPDGSQIAYLGYRVVFTGRRGLPYSWVTELHVTRADGSGDQKLRSSGQDGKIEFSPDGTRLLFESDREDDRGPALFLANRDGTCPTMLRVHAGEPAWQPVPGRPPSASPIQCVDLGVSAPVHLRARVGSVVGWKVRVSNDGNLPASGVRLSGSGVTRLGRVKGTPDSGTCSTRGVSVECHLGNLAAGAAIVVRFAARTTDFGRAGMHEVATADGVDVDETNDSTSFEATIAGVDWRGRTCTADGTKDRDSLYGTRRVDVVCGHGGPDAIFGGSGNDDLDGGPGNDVLAAGSGGDHVFGGSGNDLIRARDRQRDFIACGPGRDTVSADRIDRVAPDCELSLGFRRRPRLSPLRGADAVEQPIEGYWTYEASGGSLVQIRPAAGGGFEAVELTSSPNAQCPAEPGHVLLRLSGSGTHYTGQQEWYRMPGCALAYAPDAVLDLDSLDSAQACSSSPWDGHRDCARLVRGCGPGIRAGSGAPACVGSSAKFDARRVSAEWATSATVFGRLARRLRGSDRARLVRLARALRTYAQRNADAFSIIAKDPPRADFNQVSRFRPFGMSGQPAIQALLRNFSQTTSAGQALVLSIDRAAGARLANDAQALTAQNAAALANARMMGALMTAEPRLARRALTRLRGRSSRGRALLRQVRSRSFSSRVALSALVLREFVEQNS